MKTTKAAVHLVNKLSAWRAACGQDAPARETKKPGKVTCGGCKRSRAYRAAIKAAVFLLAVLVATSAHAQDRVRAQGRVVDQAGNPISGSVYPYRVTDGHAWRSVLPPDAPPEAPPVFGAPLEWSEVSAGAVGAGHPKGQGYFDVPGGLPEGEYWLDVHGPGGGWAGPFVPGGEVAAVRVGGPPPLPDLRDAPAITPIARQFTAGTWTNSVSYYGCNGAPLDRIQRDLTRFRAKGFGNVRCWATWFASYSPDASLIRDDGSIDEFKAGIFQGALDFGAAIGVSFDLTIDRSLLRNSETAHKAALRNVLSLWGNHPALRLVDVENEAEDCSDGCLNASQFAYLMSVARSIPHTALVSVSISGDGVPDKYRSIFAQTRGDLLLPHFSRESGWGAKEGDRARELARAFPGLAIYHQEPARRGVKLGYDAGNWPVSEFENAFKTARAAGSVGECFHTQAGFDLRTRDAWDQFDAVEREVVANVYGWTR